MRAWKMLFVVALLSIPQLARAAEAGEAAGNQLIGRDKINQQRAHDLTRDLLCVLLDSHIQQLRDNKLTDLSLFADLTEMRGRLDELAGKGYMMAVIKTLVAAETATDDEREKLHLQARKQMHTVLLKLLAERERLRLRRKQAELIERLIEMIAKQRETRGATQTLRGDSEQAILVVSSSQGEVKTLYDDFAETLDEVASWAGELGAVAAESKRILTKEKVDESLVSAHDELAGRRFTEAATEQQKVIDGLERVMTEVRRLEDPSWINEDVVEAIKELIKEQEEIREQTRTAELSDQKADALVDAQSLVQQKLQRLQNQISSSERAASLVDRAESSASQARESLFIKESEKAVEQEGRVIGALTELQKEIENQLSGIASGLSAEEYEALADELGKTREQLETAKAAADPEAAR
ncbi:MAG: hypothetical protein VX257_03860, partial [Planctomycetota bacterium]|nr:hypothetical protein [Planctomycetota bacterium]